MKLYVLCITIIFIQNCHSKDNHNRGPYYNNYKGEYNNREYGNGGLNIRYKNGGYNNGGYRNGENDKGGYSNSRFDNIGYENVENNNNGEYTNVGYNNERYNNGEYNNGYDGNNNGGLVVGTLSNLPLPNLPVPLPTNYTERIERPCHKFDITCIRRFFAKHSHCKEAYESVPEPLYRAKNAMYLPRVNFTVNALDAEYFGLNGRIEEFYINRDTDNLVMAVEFKEVSVESHKTVVRYHRPAREPVIAVGYANATYGSIVTTIIIPNINHLNLAKSEAFSYVNDPLLKFAFGPSIVQYPDPAFQAGFLAFLADVPVNIREVQLTEAPYFIATFIQCSICNFGLKIL